MMSLFAKFKWVLGLIVVLGLAACETTNTRASVPYSGNGVVQSIDLVKGGIAGSGLGLGTVAGGVVGGILGNQVGSGTGQTVATVGGAAAGAYVGHQLEKNRSGTSDGYKFNLRMDDGSYQTLTRPTLDNFKVGDRIRVENGALYRR